jgi:hypothetical protein
LKTVISDARRNFDWNWVEIWTTPEKPGCLNEGPVVEHGAVGAVFRAGVEYVGIVCDA